LVKQIKILENRLDKANQKFNEAISVNKNLRQQIDSLRRERVIFDNLYKKLEKELHDKRKKMAEIIETANSAYEERDKANDQIENLKQQAKREAKDFENELKELSQLAEKNRKTLEYIKMVKLKKDDQNTAHDPIDSEKISKTKSQKLFKERILDQQLIEKHKKLELDYAKIQAATNIRSFNELIKNFIEIEEKNFNMFKFVNDLSNEIENEERTIADYKGEKRLHEGKGNQLTLQKKRYLKELEEKSNNSRDKTELFESKSMAGQRSLNSVFALIETLFNTIECDKSLAKEINATQGVSESNIMNYMGIIEDRVTEILHAYGIIMSNVNFFVCGGKNFHRKISRMCRSMWTAAVGTLTSGMPRKKCLPLMNKSSKKMRASMSSL
jgi:myosin heavy subunit